MRLRKILVPAAALAALAMIPASISAQSRGSERSQEARAESGQPAHAGSSITQLPRGIAQVFGPGELPEGIAKRYTPPAPPSTPDPEPPAEPPTEECSSTVVFVGGLPFIQDCNGNLTPLG